MLTLLSPAKSLDFTTKAPTSDHSLALFAKEVDELAELLREKSSLKISKLMSISPKLAEQNYQRFQAFNTEQSREKQALFAYDGDVYQGLAASSFSNQDIEFAQHHLLIVSGLYGLIRPLDLIQPYRLEMSIKLATKTTKDLYEFWGNKLTNYINDAISSHHHKIVVNLASNEYSQAIHPHKLLATWLKVDFKERKGNDYKIVAIHAKKARGLMARFIIQNNIDEPEALKGFTVAGYSYNAALSNKDELIFTRG